MDFRNLITILSSVAFISYCYIGVYIFFSAPDEAKNRNFFYFCMCFMFWSFSYIIICTTKSNLEAAFWQKAAYTGALTYEVFILRFFLFFTGSISKIKYRKLFSIVLWIVPALFIYQNIFNNAVAEGFPEGFWYIGLHVLANSYNLASLVLLSVWRKNSTLKRERKQYRVIVFSGIITMAITFFCDYFMGFYHMPTLTPVLILIWIISLLYAIVRYKFLILSPEIIAAEIFTYIDEFVILLNPQKKVIKYNKRILSVLDIYSPDNLTLADLFPSSEELAEKLDSLMKSNDSSVDLRLNIGNKEKGIPLGGRFSVIKDRFDDIIGLLFLGREIKGIEEIKIKYGLSKREMEIVEHLLSGKCNRVIAGDLSISENTLKAHITNIYNKFGINNKLEMVSLLKKYELIPESDKILLF